MIEYCCFAFFVGSGCIPTLKHWRYSPPARCICLVYRVGLSLTFKLNYLTVKLSQCIIKVVLCNSVKNMRLKSWESPRSEGRNSKGKGGSARARQLKKQQQTLRKQLKAQNAQLNDRPKHKPHNKSNNQGKEIQISFPNFLCFSSIPLDVRTNGAIERV
jgi:hypothetical protein